MTLSPISQKKMVIHVRSALKIITRYNAKARARERARGRVFGISNRDGESESESKSKNENDVRAGVSLRVRFQGRVSSTSMSVRAGVSLYYNHTTRSTHPKDKCNASIWFIARVISWSVVVCFLCCAVCHVLSFSDKNC